MVYIRYYFILISEELGNQVMTQKIGFIGAGNMAGAIIEGLLNTKTAAPNDLHVYDVNPAQCERFNKKGIQSLGSIEELIQSSSILFLCIKPQNYQSVLSEINGSREPISDKIFVSIAAGISTAYIKSVIGSSCKVVRAMPNTPLLLGSGATALSHCDPVTKEEFNLVKSIFETGGTVEQLDEDKMNAVIAVNGSSPAYVYLFAKAIIEGAGKLGIESATAKNLISQTLIGSARMLTESGYEPDELIKMVSSPGGTTLKALEALYEHDFEAAVIDAMNRCTLRAEELGK